MTQPLYTVRQVAYVVRDMEKALKYWTEYLKVGPFFMLEHALWKTKNTEAAHQMQIFLSRWVIPGMYKLN